MISDTVIYLSLLVCAMADTDKKDSGLDPFKSFFELLKEAIVNPSIYMLTLGTALLILSINMLESESPGISLVVLFISLFLIIVSVREILKDLNISRKTETLKKEIEDKDKDISKKDATIEQLKGKITQVLELEDDNNSTLQRVKALLSEFGSSNSQETISLTRQDYRYASDWVKGRKNNWVKNIDLSDYSNYGVNNRQNEGLFTKELKQHLNLFCYCLLNGVRRRPSVEKLEKSVSPLAYKKAFQEFDKVLKEEIKSEPDILTLAAKEYLQKTMSAFIKFIDK